MATTGANRADTDGNSADGQNASRLAQWRAKHADDSASVTSGEAPVEGSHSAYCECAECFALGQNGHRQSERDVGPEDQGAPVALPVAPPVALQVEALDAAAYSPMVIESDGYRVTLTNDLIIDFVDDISDELINSVMQDIGASVMVGAGEDLQLWSVSGDVDAATAALADFGVATSVERNGFIENAVSSVIFQQFVAPPPMLTATSVTPNDPYFSSTWGMNKISAPQAWKRETGDSSVIVGVIDSGIDIDHPDLINNLWVNTGEIWGDGIDNDGNGFIDDYNGYDFVRNAGIGPGYAYDDEDGHGTHVAGTIAAEGNNGIGVAGVAWDARLMAAKFLDANGDGYTFNAVRAVHYTTDNGAQVTNNSWGGGGYSSLLYNAIDQARQAGNLFVAAAGNDGTNNDSAAHYPSNYTLDNVISVASTTASDARSSFSNYGEISVDLAAPGSSIYSTTKGGGYGYKSGTSMAAPHVTGAIALMLASDPTLTYSEIRDALFSSADAVSSMDGVSVTGGRLNVDAALAAVGASPPVPLTGVSLSHMTVDENAAGAVVGVLSAAGGTGNVSFAIATDPSGDFEIRNGSLALRDGIELDHEAVDTHDLTIRATDENGETLTADFAISVADVNDIPTIDFGVSSEVSPGGLSPSAQSSVSGDENTPLSVTSITVADPENDPLSLSITAGNGALALSSASGLTFADANGADGSLAFFGTLADLNAAFAAGLTYTPDVGFNGLVSLSVTADDGSGGVTTETLEITVIDNGVDESSYIGTDTADILNGSELADTLFGYGGDDMLNGGAGNDILRGGLGINRLIGEDGDDRFVYGGGFDTASGDAGTDIVDFSVFGSAVWLYLGSTGTEAWTRNGTDLDSGTWLGIAEIDGVEDALGTAFDDELRGSSGDNVLDGGAGDDVLRGEEGNDRLMYTGGFDTISGGAGIDTVDFSAFGSAVQADLGTSGTEASTRNSADLQSGAWQAIAEIDGVENVLGSSFADELRGDNRDNLIDGNEGDDVLIHSGGMDTYAGGAGTDTIDYSAFGSAVWLYLGSSGTEAWTRNSSDLLTGDWQAISQISGVENATGTAFADELRGDGGNNVIDGGAGDDIVRGEGGDDRLIYGGGFDTISGGAGTDTADFSGFGSAIDVDLGATGAEARTRNGADLSSGAWQDIAALDGIENVTGTSFADVLRGDNGNNWINGGAGDDRLVQSGGFDTLSGGDGTDTADFSTQGSAVWVFLGSSGTEAWIRNGADLDSGAWQTVAEIDGVENVAGSAFSDMLRGSSGNNVLTGGAGNDHLQGDGGDDTYMFARGDAADTIDNTGEGTSDDTVQFGAAIDHDQLWFRRAGDDLSVSVIGTTDSVTVDNWFAGEANRLDFDSGNGYSLTDTSVQTLVDAMASFTPPALGETDLDPGATYYDPVTAAITSSWQNS